MARPRSDRDDQGQPADAPGDRAGIWASLCFPSLVSGFCGAVYSRAEDKELGLACLRAFNDWHLEVWAGTYPDRIIPLQLPWLADPDLAATEVRAPFDHDPGGLARGVRIHDPCPLDAHHDALLICCSAVTGRPPRELTAANRAQRTRRSSS